MTLRSTLLFASVLALGAAGIWYLGGLPDEVRGAETAEGPRATSVEEATGADERVDLVAATKVDAETASPSSGSPSTDASGAGTSATATEVAAEPTPQEPAPQEPAPELSPAEQVLANYVREQGRDPRKFLSTSPDVAPQVVERLAGRKVARLVESGRMTADELGVEDRAAFEAYQARRAEANAKKQAADGDR